MCVLNCALFKLHENDSFVGMWHKDILGHNKCACVDNWASSSIIIFLVSLQMAHLWKDLFSLLNFVCYSTKE